MILSCSLNLHFLVSVHPVHVAPARGAVHDHVHIVAHLSEVLTRGQNTHVTLHSGQDDVANLQREDIQSNAIRKGRGVGKICHSWKTEH